MKGRFHPLAWLLWLLAAAFLVVQVRNPLYLLILLMGIAVVATVCRINPLPVPFAPARLAVVILLLSTVFHMFTAHLGNTVLFSLPSSWWLIGGAITLESAVAGATNGLGLLALILLFLTFNMAVPLHELSRLTPPALRDVGMIMLIGLTYMPQTARHWKQIREAQAIRGHRLRTWRDWRPVVIPLLIGGLERSVHLAEAMVARGYGSTSSSSQPLPIRLALLVGLATILGGWVWAGWWPAGGWAVVLGGVAVIVAVYWQLGRRSPRTTYRPRSWRRADTLLLLATLFLLLPLLLERVAGRSIYFYTPYPVLTLPPFEPLAGLALVLIAAPALLELVWSGVDEVGQTWRGRSRVR